MTIWQSSLPQSNWDESQAKRNAHFLQSSAWATFLAAQNKPVLYAEDTNWSWLAVIEESKLGKYIYCPYGPTINSAEALGAALDTLKDCAKSNSVDFIRIEPQGPLTELDLRKYKLQPAHRDIQPKHTLVKDLTRDDEELLAEMSSTNRRLYRRAEAAGFSFTKSYNPEDIGPFLEMSHEVAERQGILVHTDNYFTLLAQTLLPLKAATLFYAIFEGKPVASCLAFDGPTTRYYAHAASADSARKIQPGPPLMGHVIFDAKAAGKKYFDYYGIAPPDQPDHKWAGITQFKKSFGGEVKTMLGTWELPVNTAKYQAYRFVRKIRR